MAIQIVGVLIGSSSSRASKLTLLVRQQKLSGMNDAYEFLINGLRSRGVATYFQGPEQLVVSRQRGLVLPFSGNSFWVSFHDGPWYLCTWAPTCYRLPTEKNLVDLCVEFVDYGQSAQAEVPTQLIERFGMTELSGDEFERLYSNS